MHFPTTTPTNFYPLKVSAFCITAAAHRAQATAAGDILASSVFELEISADSMSAEESQEAQVCVQALACILFLDTMHHATPLNTDKSVTV